jgi:ORF6N domain-containing protein
MSRDELVSSVQAVPLERVEQAIHVVRGKRVILAADLAHFYGVLTWRLNEQIKRNKKRFPDDFVFQLTQEEDEALTSQTARSKKGRGGRRTLPFAFTEHGAIMAATVLNTPQAVLMSVFVVRAFVQMRETLTNHHELVRKLAELERRLTGHDGAIRHLFDVIRQLLGPPEPPPGSSRKQIGFHVREGKAAYRHKRRETTR